MVASFCAYRRGGSANFESLYLDVQFLIGRHWQRRKHVLRLLIRIRWLTRMILCRRGRQPGRKRSSFQRLAQQVEVWLGFSDMEQASCKEPQKGLGDLSRGGS